MSRNVAFNVADIAGRLRKTCTIAEQKVNVNSITGEAKPMQLVYLGRLESWDGKPPCFQGIIIQVNGGSPSINVTAREVAALIEHLLQDVLSAP